MRNLFHFMILHCIYDTKNFVIRGASEICLLECHRQWVHIHMYEMFHEIFQQLKNVTFTQIKTNL